MATANNRTNVGKRPAGARQHLSQFGSFKAAEEKAPGTWAEEPVVKPMILSHGT